MMSASEAAMKSNEVIKEVIKQHETEELKEIEALIEKEVMSGGRDVSYDGTISKNARAELERLGYKVEVGSQYNEGYVMIEW